MVLSAPSISFNPTTISFGTIDVGQSAAYKSFHVRNKAGSYATAKNCSFSFLGSSNASEAKTETWVKVATSKESIYIGSMAKGPECAAASVVQSYPKSINVKEKVKVASDATTSGTVLYKLHFRYQYTG